MKTKRHVTPGPKLYSSIYQPFEDFKHRTLTHTHTHTTHTHTNNLTLFARITQISITAKDEWANCGDARLYVIKILILLALLTFATCLLGVL